MFQTIETLLNHHNSILELFKTDQIDLFSMDLRIQLNAFWLNNLTKMITVNWSIFIVC
jgi:hypothetical protein